MIINRPLYLDKLNKLRDKDIIKVISGVRRCGKSTLLRIFQEKLKNTGVSETQIQYYNFENPVNLDWVDKWRDLYDHIVNKMVNNQPNYVFLDEIQNITDFEKLADGLFVKEGIDLYITGSNAYFLSSDLATILSGRYIEIKMLPLSFAEYISAFDNKTDLSQHFMNYLTFGGFPQTLDFNDNHELMREYLQGVYNTVLSKDVITRTGINDKEVLDDISSYMLDNISNITAAKRISDTLTSKGRPISHSTVEKYITALSDSLLFYPIDKIGLKGRKRLYSQKKYYTVDTGIRQLILGASQTEDDRGRLLENVVFFELLRRNQKVKFGRADDKEVDFVVTTSEGYTKYYQVTWTARGKETHQRELAPLEALKDHNPKYLLTMDYEEPVENGIRQLNVMNWLLNNQE